MDRVRQTGYQLRIRRRMVRQIVTVRAVQPGGDVAEKSPMRVIEVSRRPVYDAALAISLVVLAGNGQWPLDGAWVVVRRVLLAALTVVIVNALIDVSVDQRLRWRLTASGDADGASPRVIGPWTRAWATTVTLLAIFGVSRLVSSEPPFSLALALSTVLLTLGLGVAELGLARHITGEGHDLGPTPTRDVVLSLSLLALCALDAALGLSQGPAPARVFALVIVGAVVLVARSVDATLRQRRAVVAALQRVDARIHENACGKGANWGAAADDARDGEWATQAVLAALDLREGLKVADVGAGAGYFTRKLCERVGPTGRVFASDRDTWAASRLRELGEGFAWLTTMRVDDSVPLPISERVDRVLLANVGLFALRCEREGRAHLQDLAAKIYPGGLLVVFQEFVHAAGWQREPGVPAHPEDDCDAAALVAWAEAHFELIAQPTLPEPAKPYQPREKKGYLLVLRRR